MGSALFSVSINNKGNFHRQGFSFLPHRATDLATINIRKRSQLEGNKFNPNCSTEKISM
jgi:hypothetical protein